MVPGKLVKISQNLPMCSSCSCCILALKHFSANSRILRFFGQTEYFCYSYLQTHAPRSPVSVFPSWSLTGVSPCMCPFISCMCVSCVKVIWVTLNVSAEQVGTVITQRCSHEVLRWPGTQAADTSSWGRTISAPPCSLSGGSKGLSPQPTKTSDYFQSCGFFPFMKTAYLPQCCFFTTDIGCPPRTCSVISGQMKGSGAEVSRGKMLLYDRHSLWVGFVLVDTLRMSVHKWKFLFVNKFGLQVARCRSCGLWWLSILWGQKVASII